MPLLVYLNRAISTNINYKANYFTGRNFSNILNMDEHVFFTCFTSSRAKQAWLENLVSQKNIYILVPPSVFFPRMNFPGRTLRKPGLSTGRQRELPKRRNLHLAWVRVTHILVANVALVGYCTKYRPLQHPNIKLPCNNDKATTGGTTNDSPFTAEFPAFPALWDCSLSVSVCRMAPSCGLMSYLYSGLTSRVTAPASL